MKPSGVRVQTCGSLQIGHSPLIRSPVGTCATCVRWKWNDAAQLEHWTLIICWSPSAQYGQSFGFVMAHQNKRSR